MRKKLNQYAIYKGDKLIAMGTAQEIAEQEGIKPYGIYRMLTPSYKKLIQGKEKRRIAIKVDDVDE